MAAAAQGKRIVVTGAAGGIGLAIAARLVEGGATVVLADVRPEVRDCAASLSAHAVIADLSSEEGVSRLVAQSVDLLGAIDVWYGNAGVELGGGLAASEALWQTTIDINLMAHVRAARLLVPSWVERGEGRFVVTASAAGLLTMLDSAAYSASKHAAVAFAEWLSATYRHRGIVVQAICPQGVQTRMLGDTPAAAAVTARDAAVTPEVVAEAAWGALQGDGFLVLPHPEVADYYAHRATDTDRWLATMNRMQQHVLEGA